MKRTFWITASAILLLGGGELIAIQLWTDAGPPPAPGAPQPASAAPEPQRPATPPPRAEAAARPSLAAPPPVALPRVVSEGRAGLAWSPDPDVRGEELEAVRAQRKAAMMDFLNRRAEQVAAERAGRAAEPP